MHTVTRLIAQLAGAGIVLFARLLTAVRSNWRDGQPALAQRIYFANHTSHGDFVLLLAGLPSVARASVRPVAAADYWLQGPLRRFFIRHVFRGVLIDRRRDVERADPIEVMASALDDGASLIVFPEGTRNGTDQPLLAFRRGIHRLAIARPHIELVPAWITNLNRVLPKGELLPVPLLCTITFGAPLRLTPGEPETAFLQRARQALLTLGTESPACAAGVQS